jgi:hypothetical protein
MTEAAALLIATLGIVTVGFDLVFHQLNRIEDKVDKISTVAEALRKWASRRDDGDRREEGDKDAD